MPRGCGPLNPRSNGLEDSDVLCANRLATVRVTRLSRLRRSAYPLASACCGAKEDRSAFTTTRLPSLQKRRLFNECYEPIAVGAVQSSPWKQCKKGAPPKPNEVGLVGKGEATE